MVLCSVAPHLHPWVGQNSEVNMLTTPLLEWTLSNIFMGFLKNSIPSLSANSLVISKVKMLKVFYP